MAFILAFVLIVVVPAVLLGGVIVTPLFRLKQAGAKPLAVVTGTALSVLFAWVIFVALIAGSAQLGHPF